MKLPDRVRLERVIPVARGLDAVSAPLLVAALKAGGIGSVEITVEGPSGFDAIEAVAENETLVGAGTVVSVAQAADAVVAGAAFLVSPHLELAVLSWAMDRGIPLIPGALTPTEIAAARGAGAHVVKVFPADLGGPGYLRSLLAPYPDLELIPTGGVTAHNAADFLAAGAAAVGVGGWLTAHDDYDEVARRAGLLMAAISNVGPT